MECFKKIGIIYASWHSQYISLIREKCIRILLEKGVLRENIEEIKVPGSNEIPFVASRLAHKFNSIICIGILIKEDSLHFENIRNCVSRGILQAESQTGVPMIDLILSCYSYNEIEDVISSESFGSNLN